MGTSTKVMTGSIAGMIVGLLVMKGYIAPQDADITTQNLDVFFGAVLTIVSVIGFFAHHVKQVDPPKEPTSQEPRPIEPQNTQAQTQV